MNPRPRPNRPRRPAIMPSGPLARAWESAPTGACRMRLAYPARGLVIRQFPKLKMISVSRI